MVARTALSLATAVALLGSLLLPTSRAALDDEEVLIADDACTDGSEQCELSLRQLRGELRAAAVSAHTASNSDDSSQGEEDTEEWDDAVYGPFCCQSGGGQGYSDPTDIGATCYPTAKAELDGYCDAPGPCVNDCKGTWVAGFCGFAAEGKEGSDVCKTALKGPKSLRAAQDSPCATKAACGGCNGTWCHYKKSPNW